MDINEIKGLINKDILEQQIDVNSDAYGGACVKGIFHCQNCISPEKDLDHQMLKIYVKL